MKISSRLCFFLVSVLAACNGSLLYHLQVSEIVDGKKIRTEEREVLLTDNFLASEPPAFELEYGSNGNAKDEHVENYFGSTSRDFSVTRQQLPSGKEERFTPEEHMVFDTSFGGLAFSPNWSAWTCCRRVVNIQSRERVRKASKMEMEYKKCSGNYCKAHLCKDNVKLCQHFLKTMGARICNPKNFMATFMSHNCPKMCGFCNSAPIQAGGPRPSQSRTAKTAPTEQLRNRPVVVTPPKHATAPWRPRPTTRQVLATRKPTVSHSNIVKVKIFKHSIHAPYNSYKFTISSIEQPQSPWRKIPDGDSDLEFFYLYGVPTALFTMQINFCAARDPFGFEKWTVTKKPCPEGWTTRFQLFGSERRLQFTRLYFVGNRGKPLSTSSVSTRLAEGYTESLFFFYGPKSDKAAFTTNSAQKPFTTPRRLPATQQHYTTPRPLPQTQKPPVTPWTPRTVRHIASTTHGTPRPTQRPRTRPRTVPRRLPNIQLPPTTPWQPREAPQRLTTTPWIPQRPNLAPHRPTQPQIPNAPFRRFGGFRPPYPSSANQPFSTSIFNQNCLRAHNFFRAVHNVPALKWSPKLAKSAQSWADELRRIAPNRPTEFKHPHLRTSNWPHSDSGKFRNSGDGENIAWDLSGDGSPVEESVLRWYSEVFYYNRKHPTYRPARNKPVGHVTQLLWKDTTHVGCGMATTRVRSSFTRTSTWTVAHYSPGGNVRYRSSGIATKLLYDEQVPNYEKAACMTKSKSCYVGNQCMAFGPSKATCACTGRKPSCESSGGCIAWCENKSAKYPWKEECAGRSKCSCGTEGATCQ